MFQNTQKKQTPQAITVLSYYTCDQWDVGPGYSSADPNTAVSRCYWASLAVVRPSEEVRLGQRSRTVCADGRTRTATGQPNNQERGRIPGKVKTTCHQVCAMALDINVDRQCGPLVFPARRKTPNFCSPSQGSWEGPQLPRQKLKIPIPRPHNSYISLYKILQIPTARLRSDEPKHPLVFRSSRSSFLSSSGHSEHRTDRSTRSVAPRDSIHLALPARRPWARGRGSVGPRGSEAGHAAGQLCSEGTEDQGLVPDDVEDRSGGSVPNSMALPSWTAWGWTWTDGQWCSNQIPNSPCMACLYIDPRNHRNVGKYVSPMERLGICDRVE